MKTDVHKRCTNCAKSVRIDLANGEAEYCPYCGTALPHKFNELHSRMFHDAEDRGCEGALLNALQFSRNMDDLRACVKQAHGVASEGFIKQWKNI